SLASGSYLECDKTVQPSFGYHIVLNVRHYHRNRAQQPYKRARGLFVQMPMQTASRYRKLRSCETDCDFCYWYAILPHLKMLSQNGRYGQSKRIDGSLPRGVPLLSL